MSGSMAAMDAGSSSWSNLDARSRDRLQEVLDALMELTGASAGWIGLSTPDRGLDFPVRRGAFSDAWLALQQDLDSQGITVDPVAVVDDAGEPLPATREVLGLAARHQLVVATGHLSAFEARAIADAAIAAGVRHVIATHPEFPQQNMCLDDQQALARMGVFLERCFTTSFTSECDWQRIVGNIRATGPAARRGRSRWAWLSPPGGRPVSARC